MNKAYERLLNDVTIEELKTMRENGMSNQQIADALGVHYTTILAHLGPQPKDMKRSYTRKAKPAPAPAPEPEEETVGLVVQNKKIDLDGLFARYCVDCKKGEILIEISETMVLIRRENLDDFINELKALRRNLDKLTVQNEMW